MTGRFRASAQPSEVMVASRAAPAKVNMKPADELLMVRQKIKDLQAREAEIKTAMLDGGASTVGDFAIARFTTRATSRFDRKAAEKEVGSLARFDVKSEASVLLVEELIRDLDGVME